MPTEKSLLLGPEMARAYAEDRKWVTRRKMKHQPNDVWSIPPILVNGDGYYVSNGCVSNYRCPYGQAGERIRLLTTWAVHSTHDDLTPSELPEFEGNSLLDAAPISVWSAFDPYPKPEYCGRLRIGCYLPLSLRHWMPYPKIVGVSAEQVQDIGPGARERNYWVWRVELQKYSEVKNAN